MILFIECFVLCIIFSLAVLPAQYHNPLSQFASYPAAIKQRVYELPEYKDFISEVERKNWIHKAVSSIFMAAFLAVAAYFSGSRTFVTACVHVFIMFLTVNLYDLIVLDLFIFCHSKKLRIPGTEDMDKEYKNPWHHVKGAAKGIMIGTFVALLSGCIVQIILFLR